MISKILSHKKNPLLQREEIVLEVENALAPTFNEVKKMVGRDETLTVVRRVDGSFGKQIFTAEVIVYNSEKAKNKIEVVPKKIKKKLEEERKKAEEEAKKKSE
jgi:ribosomal protein S24E